MVTTNHQQDITIYQMVLDRLPFVLDDSCDSSIKLAIQAVDFTSLTLTVDGDQREFLRVGAKHEVVETSVELKVCDWSYDSGTDQTTITYFALSAGDASVGNTLCLFADFNQQLISRYIYQMMVQLQPCFQISPETDVGNEDAYTLLQKMIIADLVSWYILFRQALINGQGDSNNSDPTPTPAPQKYVKTAKSGEVSYTFDYLDVSKTGYAALDTAAMMANFKNNAVCLARQLGCEVEVCADGSISCSCANNASPIVEGAILVASPLKRCGKRNKYFL